MEQALASSGRLGTVAGAFVVMLGVCALGACSQDAASDRGGCPLGTTPCGNGCRPAGAVCCDDGTRTTSSYCTNEAGGGCFPNDRGCAAAFPSGALARFCCAPSGDFGSNDCPSGQRHCGLSCTPDERPCCEGDECTSFGESDGCPQQDTLCAACPELGLCRYCPSGSCCSGDTCSAEGPSCVTSAVCTGLGPGPGNGGGGECSSSADCDGNAICVSGRNCIRSGQSCSCAGSTAGTCVDFVAAGLDVHQCGACSASFSACCPGASCVNGQCQASCP